MQVADAACHRVHQHEQRVAHGKLAQSTGQDWKRLRSAALPNGTCDGGGSGSEGDQRGSCNRQTPFQRAVVQHAHRVQRRRLLLLWRSMKGVSHAVQVVSCSLQLQSA